MECDQWKENGLLYMADELDGVQKKQFFDHVQVCESCQEELARCTMERKEFFTPAMFEDAPSPAVDAEILRVCSRPIRPALVSSMFHSFITNSIAALFILTVGFSGGAYFAGIKIASDKKLVKANTIQGTTSAQKVISTQNTLALYDEESNIDSAKLSDSLPMVIKRGNLNMQGVIPVDLSDE